MEKHIWAVETSEGVSLSVERFGSVDQPAVILISGAGAPAAFWPDDFCESIARTGFQVVRFDHRDTGSSTHLDDVYPIDVLVDDVIGITNEVSATETHLIGHSMGGYIVAMILADLPMSSIKTGTAIAAGPTSDLNRYAELGMSTVTEETWAALLGNVPSGRLENDLQGWLSSWQFLNGDRDFDRALAEAYTRELYTGDPRNAQVAVNHVHAMTTLPSNLPERLASVTSPFLVIHGSQDKLVPIDNGLALSRIVPGATFYELRDAGHMFFLNATWQEIATVVQQHFH